MHRQACDEEIAQDGLSTPAAAWTAVPSAGRATGAPVPPGTTEAPAIARWILDGFDLHYARFRDCARAARRHFAAAAWLAILHVGRDRIDFYDQRVAVTAQRIERELAAVGLDGTSDTLWEQVKLHYIGLLIGHRQPECAETFFNSVSVKILRRAYYHNRFIFVRPATSTEHIDAEPPTYRSYYPLQQGLRQAAHDIVLDLGFDPPFADVRRDLVNVLRAFRARLPRPFELEANHQVQVLQSPFFRNQTAYVAGRVINGGQVYPFVVAVKHDGQRTLRVDALLTSERELGVLFSANRAYFLVDMEVPSAYVAFLRSMVPDKSAAELYTMVGLQKQGKNLFYRDFLHHLRHSRDQFVIAPGIPGLVMSVFTLPSYPYVFKVIRDRIAASKDTDRERVKQKYTLVKRHDRVGRMTDVLEYSHVPFPLARFSAELLAELRNVAPSIVDIEGDQVIVRHLYIERRMVPLNLYLETCDEAGRVQAMREYGNALKELAAVNIFPGDLLYKNFGVTRYGRVVFYDYDELEYLADCNFRRIPATSAGQDDMSHDVWYPVGAHDVFPEEFATFLLTDARTRAAFMAAHADLLTPEWWQARQREIATRGQAEVLSYPDALRFPAAPQAPASAAAASSPG
jgi:isocitrate dehydrogenase kinase/phosphatase